MLDRHRLHRRRIIPHQTSDGLTLANMRGNDFRYIRRLHPPVPHARRIDDHHRAFIAQPHTAAGRELHLPVEAMRLELPI